MYILHLQYISYQSYKAVKKVNCCEKNVVYAISFMKCDQVVYGGETERAMGERMKGQKVINLLITILMTDNIGPTRCLSQF